jgi:hypothetical protein
MKFIIFVIDRKDNTADGNEMAAIDAFNDSLVAGRHWIHAAGIDGGANGLVIDNRADAGLATAGSLFNEAEHYSGFWLIQADDAETAKRLAFEGSKACNRRVELRPYLGN